MCMQYSMLLLLVADYNLKVDCVSLSMYYDIKKKQTRMLLARMTRSEAFVICGWTSESVPLSDNYI